MITFRQLEIFAGVVAHGSFRRCADHLGISPEAVSGNIRTLEEQLGYDLFRRQAGGPATLTSLGERAFQHASNILDDLAYLNDGADRPASRKIVLGAHPFVMRYLQDGIDAFRTDHPGVALDLDLDGGGALDLPQKVARRMVDLAYYFTLEESETEPPPFTVTMGHEPLAIFVARDHPLAGKAIVTAADLAPVPVIHLSQRTALRLLIDRALSSYGIVGSPIAVETDEYGLILNSVRHGRGYVCMFASAAEEVSEANAITMLAMERPLPSLQIRRVARSLHRGAPVTELERQLRDGFPASPTG